MSASTGEVALNLMDQSFSGDLAMPPASSDATSSGGNFGSMIRKRGGLYDFM